MAVGNVVHAMARASVSIKFFMVTFIVLVLCSELREHERHDVVLDGRNSDESRSRRQFFLGVFLSKKWRLSEEIFEGWRYIPPRYTKSEN